MRAFRFFGVMLLSVIVLLSACASVTQTDTQQIAFTARDRVGRSIEKVDCHWKNSKASGTFQTPAIVNIHRDSAALQIECQHPTLGKSVELINSRGSTAMAGNAIAGGLIGVAIDHSTGAGYQYPTTVAIWFSNSLPTAK
jgi:hypothetical protein